MTGFGKYVSVIGVAFVITLFVSGCEGALELGNEGAECYPNGTCNQGLTCFSNLCVLDDSGLEDVQTDSGGEDTYVKPDQDANIPGDANVNPDQDANIPGDVNPNQDATISGDVLLNPKLLVFDKTAAIQSTIESGRVVIPNSVVMLPSSTPLRDLSRVAAGTILIGEYNPDKVSTGIFLRVKDVIKDGTAWRITPDTSNPPTLEEAIEQGSLNVATSIPFRDASQPVLYNTRFLDGFSLEPDAKPFCQGSAGISGSLSIGVDFTPEFKFDVDVGAFRIESVLAKMTGNFKAYAQASLSAAGKGKCNGGPTEIWSDSKLMLAKVGIVPVPFLARARLLMGYEVAVEGVAELEIGANASTEIGMELKYEDEKGWYPPTKINNTTTSVIGPTITMSLGGNVKVWFRVEVSGLVLGLGGPTLGSEPGLDFAVERKSADSQYYWSLDFYNSFYAKLSVEALSYTLAEYSIENLLPREWPLADGCLTGPCCSGLSISGVSKVCDDTYAENFNCSPAGCGGKVQRRIDKQYCDGTSAGCEGNIVTGSWLEVDTCIATSEKCVISGNSASCQSDSSCQSCSSCPTCNSHGSCQNNSCSCSTGYTGGCCDQCASGYTGYPTCRCVTNFCQTNNHGSGSWCSGSAAVTCTTGGTGCYQVASQVNCPDGCSSGICNTCTPICSGKCAGASDECDGVCPSNSCNGCCSGTDCNDGSSNSACGTGGSSCVNCSSSSKTCVSNSCQSSSTVEVTSVLPHNAPYNVSTTFTVDGKNLPTTLVAWIPGCDSLTYGSRTSTRATFTCTPKWAGSGAMDSVIKMASGGITIHEFVVNVTCSSPVIVDVSPLTTTRNKVTSFAAAGACIPGTAVAWIGNCGELAYTERTESDIKWTCKASATAGTFDGVIKTQNGGTTLKSFSVVVN